MGVSRARLAACAAMLLRGSTVEELRRQLERPLGPAVRMQIIAELQLRSRCDRCPPGLRDRLGRCAVHSDRLQEAAS